VIARFPHHRRRGGHRDVGFASIISDLDAGHLQIAVGPPCEHDYVRYEVRA